MPQEFEIVKELFKGQVLSGSIITIIYDAYSSAWMLGFAILKKEIENGFGVISNYNVPLQELCRAARQVDLDIEGELKRDKLVIIDIFGSKYDVKYKRKNIFYIDSVSPELINPKIDIIYESYVLPMAGKERIIRLVNTLDGTALMFGEMETLKLLNQTIAQRSKQMPDSVLILPINKDVVSKRFIGWIAGISDYVIVASTQLNENLEEKVYLVKSPEEGFTSTVYHLWITEEKSPGRLKAKKIGDGKPKRV
ncbi:hypothetical protein K1720_05570 [Thermococcus argininiproducens]|uniref:KaiC-like domain-containing protein n=1 Tax=Thermococcus argininiproducens TaxID=2866384 RepID=A0A9E7M7T4_9EURY|nr:hypothetical protein [Thermococcus argininiproducens]USG99024.1 hypothetical protein K1720_05570 [Thermococcus argininiproducens]